MATKQVNIKMSEQDKQRLDDLAEKAGRSRSDVVRQLLRGARVSRGVEPVEVRA